MLNSETQTYNYIKCPSCGSKSEILKLEYVTINPKYFRPQELPYLCGDCTKIKTILKWEPKRNIEEICRDGWNWQVKNPNGF